MNIVIWFLIHNLFNNIIKEFDIDINENLKEVKKTKGTMEK